MLGVKVTLSYLVLVGALVGIIVLLGGSTVGEMAREHTEQELRRAAVAAEQSARLDQAALLAKANFLSTGDRLYRSLKGEFVKGEEEADGEPTTDPEFDGKRHLDAHEKLTAQKYRLEELAKSEAAKRDMARVLLAREPTDLDIFLVVDHHGVGVAALGKDLYSWFGRDLSEEYASIEQVAKGGAPRVEYWMWAFKPGQEKRLHQVALAPIRRTESEEPSGVLVLGFSVNDGVAKKKQQLVAGVSDEGDAAAGGTPEFAYYRGKSIVGSTFSAELQPAVSQALAGAGLLAENPFHVGEIKIGDTPYLAMSRELSAGENPVGVAVVSNLAAASEPAEQMRIDTLLVGVVFVLIGGILLFFFIVSFLKPLEELETGIQEIIAGNKDYQWEQDSKHDLQSSLAQGLNLMSAYLQGKPMPDDESSGSSWGDLMPPTGDQPKQAPGQVKGVDLAALSAPPPKDDDDDDDDGES